MPTYRVHDATGDDLGVLQHPAPNLKPGDVVMLEDGRGSVGYRSGGDLRAWPFALLLEVAIAPTPLTSDDSIAWFDLASYLPAGRGARAKDRLARP